MFYFCSHSALQSRGGADGLQEGELSPAMMGGDWPHQVMLPAAAIKGPGFAATDDFANGLGGCSRTHHLRYADADRVVFCCAGASGFGSNRERDHASETEGVGRVDMGLGHGQIA
jgi:hypothetical protein